MPFCCQYLESCCVDRARKTPLLVMDSSSPMPRLHKNYSASILENTVFELLKRNEVVT